MHFNSRCGVVHPKNSTEIVAEEQETEDPWQSRELLMKISIVVPAYNEGVVIERCLVSLRNQLLGGYELIVVDNSSSDNTAEIAKRYADRVIMEKRPGCARARQTGFEASIGDVVATTDADTIVNPDWLQIIHDEFRKQTRPIAVHGPIYYYDGNLIQKWSSKLHSVFMQLHHLLGLPIFVGCNFAVAREAFCRSGGFNVNLGTSSDFDFSLRLRKLGRIRFCRSLLVGTSARNARFLYLFANYFRMLFFRRSGNRINAR